MAEPGLQRIAFVTSHYGTLRGGPTRAVFATCILTALIIDAVFNDRGSGPLRALIGVSNLLLMSALGIALMFRCRRWLDQRFGRVHSIHPFLQLMGLLVCQLGFFAVSRLDDVYGAGSGFPSARFLFVAAVGLWFCIRLWPRSLHYAVPTIVALGFALPYATLNGEQAIDVWELRAIVASLLVWTAAGLIDLAMLFRALPHRPEEESHAVAG